ncbi:MAG: hypothetical protein J3Q66DRAFT_391321 [Benniella sp.]|nr:MAG: hypothetical protein J3Q66DRAFT_391321 [Benniella sp.]
MPSQHPLELPEILSDIALYVHKRSLPACARVSKGWYQAFIPQIWMDVHLRTDGPHLEAMPRYGHHVITLDVDLEGHALGSLRCPNLQSLTLTQCPRSTQLVLSHPHITRLSIHDAQLLPELWTTLLQLHSLRDLDLNGVSVLEQETDMFWQLCTRLERLSVYDVFFTSKGHLSFMEFPGLKELHVDLYGIPLPLEFMLRCQNLTAFGLYGGSMGRQELNDLVERIASGTWPNLHSITILPDKVSEDNLVSIMNGMQQITCLRLNCSSAIRTETMDLLRRHFFSLNTLCLDSEKGAVTSPIAQELLSSCPLLERLWLGQIDATVIAEGKPWVCSRLRTLFMDLQFDPSTITDIQPRVFEQISRLCRLEHLKLWDRMANSEGTVARFQTTVDLRLENGLDKLSTLRSLRVIEFRDSIQRLGEKEIEWMLGHWKSLEEIRGKLHEEEPEEAMPSQHPLEIPEVLSHVASYVHERSLPACAQVSKGWYQAFIPHIWKDIKLITQKPGPEAMPRYSHHVKKLYVSVRNLLPDLPQCPNLQSLTLSEYPGSTELVLNHPHMTHLCIYQGQLLPELWTILPQLYSLRELDLQMTVVPEQETDTFWQLCTRLEQLRVFNVSISHQGQLSSMAFPGIKNLAIEFTEDAPTILEFMSRCPNLAVLRWSGRMRRQDSYKLVERIAVKTWPHLHSVSLGRQKIPEEELISIINNLQRMTCLEVACLSVIQPGTMDLLRPHFASLTTLDLDRYARPPSTSPIAQEILSSCPLLERFSFDHIDATVIAEGRPWVCTRLKFLAMQFQFDPLTISDIQPRVFEQIARLYRLGYLKLCSGFIKLPFQTTADLRLENGLDKLSTLRSLRVIIFDNSIQKMGEKEIEWMLEHWKSLEEIQGKLNREEPEIQDALARILQKHGVFVKLSPFQIFGSKMDSTLRSLRAFLFDNSIQKMGEKEIEWMLEHWKSLEVIRRKLHEEEPREAMLSRHPLELPEILSHIASYVHERSRPACARVSKGWYQAFIPHIWKDIYLTTRRPELEAMPRYSHHVKKLYVGVENLIPDLPQCPNLQSLTLSKYPGSTELILNHPHMTSLWLSQGQLLRDLWTILPQLHSLRDLSLTSINISEQETDTFWQLCTRLEQLRVWHVSIPHQGQLSSMAFPNLKKLIVGFTKDVPTILEFMSRCPNLAVLRWTARPYRQDSYDLIERIAARTWPHLHSFSFERQNIPVDDLINVMNSLQRMTRLEAACLSVIPPDTMDLLRPHFASLTNLKLNPYADPSIAQEILSSCPLLESFSFDQVDATAVAEGKPWVCTRLGFLAMHFQFDPLTISEIQPRVFEQIARLYRLGYLWLCRGYDKPPFQTTADLRLENGLDKLSTLRSLRSITFQGSIQKMGEKEIEWMLEHWMSLEKINGKCNAVDPVMQEKLVQLLKEHGVEEGH